MNSKGHSGTSLARWEVHNLAPCPFSPPLKSFSEFIPTTNKSFSEPHLYNALI